MLKPNKSSWLLPISFTVFLGLMLVGIWLVRAKNETGQKPTFPDPHAKASVQIALKPVTNVADSVSLKEIFRRSINNTTFALPLNEEINAFESLLRLSIAESFSLDDLKSQWNELGWNLHFLADGTMVVIEEQGTQRRGRGLYALRITKADPVMIQAPHRFYDTDTGLISRKLFEDHPIQAASWNTVHRKEFDMAHRSRSFFNAFTRCVTEHYPDLVNVQLHGFSSSKRKDDRAESPKTLAILSNATRSPDQRTKEFTRQMKSAFGKDRVWLFPLETAELGATKNEQASVMRQQGNGNFLHVEMTKPFRDRLVDTANDRRTLYRAFVLAFRNSGDLEKADHGDQTKVLSN